MLDLTCHPLVLGFWGGGCPWFCMPSRPSCFGDKVLHLQAPSPIPTARGVTWPDLSHPLTLSPHPRATLVLFKGQCLSWESWESSVCSSHQLSEPLEGDAALAVSCPQVLWLLAIVVEPVGHGYLGGSQHSHSGWAVIPGPPTAPVGSVLHTVVFSSPPKLIPLLTPLAEGFTNPKERSALSISFSFNFLHWE